MVKLLLAGTGLIGHRHMQHILEHPDLELVGIIVSSYKLYVYEQLFDYSA